MRPKVIVNCAMSADGKIASRERRQVRISDEEDMRRVHELRNRSGAVIVGINTVIADDPHLTVKDKYVEGPKNPIRIVLDPRGRTPKTAKVLDGRAETIIVTTTGFQGSFENAEVMVCGGEKIDLPVLLEKLAERGIRQVMVEGGGETIWGFFEAGLVDRFSIFVGSMIIGGAGSPTPADGAGFLFNGLKKMKLASFTKTTGGIILEYEVE